MIGARLEHGGIAGTGRHIDIRRLHPAAIRHRGDNPSRKGPDRFMDWRLRRTARLRRPLAQLPVPLTLPSVAIAPSPATNCRR